MIKMRVVKDVVSDSLKTAKSVILPLRSVETLADPRPLKGGLAYNTVSNDIYYADGTQWKPIGGGGSVIQFISGRNPNSQIVANNATVYYQIPTVDAVVEADPALSVTNGDQINFLKNGIYNITAMISWLPYGYLGTGDVRGVYLEVNDAEYRSFTILTHDAEATVDNVCCAQLRVTSAPAYLKVRVYQTSGSDKGLYAATSGVEVTCLRLL